jgi:hypothetical protein
MLSFQSVGNIFALQQSQADSKETDVQSTQQNINNALFSEDNLHSFSEISFPAYAISKAKVQNAGEESCSDGVNFSGQSNYPCYIVKVSSPSEIYIDDFYYHIKIRVNDKRTSDACRVGVFITNKTWISSGIGGRSETNWLGNLRYLHLKFGKLSYTYEHRMAYNRTGNVLDAEYWDQRKPILPPGTWYFIYFGCLFDLPQEDTIVSTSVRINFTGDCSDLEISSYDDGKLFGIWYGEFDANIIISKAWRFEMMINGKVSFPVNNTFLYSMQDWPIGTGFWRVRLNTPENIYKLNMLILRNYHFPDIDFQHKCMLGIEDRKGIYELRVDYIDFAPIPLFGDVNPFAVPTHFIGLDVDLR